MKSWMWVSLVIGAVIVVFLWFDQPDGHGERVFSPVDTAKGTTKLNDQSITDASATVLDGVEPLPLDEILPEVERLAAPIAQLRGSSEQAIEQLQQEADQLIQQADQLLAAENLSIPTISEEEQAEIEQRPEFRVTLEQEAALESQLESLLP